jgi:hypothetical protein
MRLVSKTAGETDFGETQRALAQELRRRLHAGLRGDLRYAGAGFAQVALKTARAPLKSKCQIGKRPAPAEIRDEQISDPTG